MSSLLEVKQYVRNFINKYDAYLKPVVKLLLALIALLTINGKLGYMQKIDNFAIVIIAALMCSFLPINFIVLISAVFIMLHMYALSLESACVVLVLMIVLFLLYFRFSPKDTVVVVITPIACIMGIPYVMPVVMGLIGGPYSIVSIACGVIIYYVLGTMTSVAPTLTSMETEEMGTRLRLIIDAILDNKVMIVLIVAFAITAIVVYVVRNLPMDYCWPIAIVGGAIIDAVIVLICDLSLQADISIAGLLFGSILAVVAGFVMQFLFFNVDYNRAEKVQFEDDEYYYYVKAVPKVTMSVSSKTVKRINSANRRPAQRPPSRSYDMDE